MNGSCLVEVHDVSDDGLKDALVAVVVHALSKRDVNREVAPRTLPHLIHAPRTGKKLR